MASKPPHVCSFGLVAMGKISRDDRQKALDKAARNKSRYAQGRTKDGIKWCVLPMTDPYCPIAHPEIQKRGLKGVRCK